MKHDPRGYIAPLFLLLALVALLLHVRHEMTGRRYGSVIEPPVYRSLPEPPPLPVSAELEDGPK